MIANHLPSGTQQLYSLIGSLGVVWVLCASSLACTAPVRDVGDERPTVSPASRRQPMPPTVAPGFASQYSLVPPVGEERGWMTFRYAYPIGEEPCRVTFQNGHFITILPHTQQRVSLPKPHTRSFSAVVTFFEKNEWGLSVPCGERTLHLASAFLDSDHVCALIGDRGLIHSPLGLMAQSPMQRGQHKPSSTGIER